jgi:hypothetical protein
MNAGTAVQDTCQAEDTNLVLLKRLHKVQGLGTFRQVCGEVVRFEEGGNHIAVGADIDFVEGFGVITVHTIHALWP